MDSPLVVAFLSERSGRYEGRKEHAKMPDYYIYLPVNDLQLVKVAQDWKKDSKKNIEIIIRESTGFKKFASRAIFGGILKNVPAGSTVYVLAHGYSAGRAATGSEAQARSILSTYGGNYPYLKKHFPDACLEIEKQGYANSAEGSTALEAALDDNTSYDAVVQILAKDIKDPSNVTINIESPGAIAIGGTRPDRSTKTYSPSDFFRNLSKEALPQVARLKIFSCYSAISGANETSSFAEQLYNLMKSDYPNTRVFGYLGATKATYQSQKVAKTGQVPANASEIWGEFHQEGSDARTSKPSKGVRMVEPGFSKVVMWGSRNQEFVPAHLLRVEFPGGQSVKGNMKMQEDESKPF
jgi:hypothetical protein